MVCRKNICLLLPKSQNWKIFIEISACPNWRFLGNYLSKRQVGWVLAKSLVLHEGYPMTQLLQGLDGFQKSLHSCALDESSLSIWICELGYDGPLYDRLLSMTDDMLGSSSLHIKYVSDVYDGFCIWQINFPGPIESVISKFTCISIYPRTLI